MKKFVLFVAIMVLAASSALAQDQYQDVTSPVGIFENGYIQVTAESEVGQTRYKAIRAATVIAQAKLLETVKGVNLVGNTTVGEGLLVSDTIKQSVQGFLQGAVVVREDYVKGENYGVVTMRLAMHGHSSLYNSMAPVIKKPSEKLAPALPEFKPQVQAQTQPVVNNYDGLIILVTGTGFKPALANRIITENQNILFEPAKVTPKMLIERGCGGYTTSEAKAKALLATWGSKNPMIVKCTEVVRSTEAVVSTSDATTIFEQDQKSNILPQAKVVFVL